MATFIIWGESVRLQTKKKNQSDSDSDSSPEQLGPSLDF